MSEAAARRRRSIAFWTLIAGVVVLDVITKAWAVRALVPQHRPYEVLGEWIRLTLVYNRGAAFGLHVGPYSRWIFLVLSIGALVILGRLYRSSQPGDLLRVTALGLVCGGAIGNLIDRIRHGAGVVDFLDIGIGEMRWPTFNVADIAVSTGAFLLAWSLWGEDAKATEPDAEARPVTSAKSRRRA